MSGVYIVRGLDNHRAPGDVRDQQTATKPAALAVVAGFRAVSVRLGSLQNGLGLYKRRRGHVERVAEERDWN